MSTFRYGAGLSLLGLLLLGSGLPGPLFPSSAADEPSASDASSSSSSDGTDQQFGWQTSQLDGRFYAEGATVGDIDGDGQLDVICGPYWYAGPDFQDRYAIYPAQEFDPHGYSDNFFCYTDDFNGDGLTDILVIGFPGAAAFWYQNPGHDQVRSDKAVWAKHLALDIVDNESPTYADLTGDGQREIICSRGGYFGFAQPDREDPTAAWQFTPISDQSAGGRFTHGLGIGDVDGDGRLDLLEKSGWWQQPESLAGNRQWQKHPFEFSGPGGAQMLVMDVDGDGRNDVITSLEAHGYGITWYRQLRQGDRIGFEPHVIVGRQPADSPFGVVFTQPHALTLADIDGDGLLDLVAGKRWWAHGPRGDVEPNAAAELYWFQLQRRPAGQDGPPAVFVPRRIDDRSGVGTDVQVHDLDGDGLLDIVTGSKLGCFVHRQTRSPRRPEAAQPDYPIAAWQAAQPAPADAPSHSADGLQPAAARDAITVPPGFHVDLIAAEPRIHQPVAFTFDTRGRIWVAEAHNYPVRAAEGQGADRIVILEDADGDGRFENRKVFIEGLNLVSGLEVGFGGVWIGAAPYLQFIPDADGDDVPDGPPQILLDGFGYEDTHETLNAFNWGPDGWLYGCQGIFVHSRVGKPGTADQDRIPFNAGVWRYHPLRHQFEVFGHGTSNPWGVDFDDHGQALITSCVIAHAFHMVQGGRYHRQAGRHFDPYTFADIRTIADHVHYAGDIADHAWWGRDEAVQDDATSLLGGGHAHCGAMIYLGNNWPTGYRNTLMMANIHGNRINLDLPRPNGSSFILAHGRDVIYANDPWFRGINLRYGPDGAVYLIDWYDPNACHRSSPDIWDRTNGRLYRVRYGDASPVPADLPSLDHRALIDLHQHPNEWFVRAARRELQYRFANPITAAHNPSGETDSGETDPSSQTAELADVRNQLWHRVGDRQLSSPHRLRYLWTCHALGSISDDETLALLADPDANLRAWALQLVTDRPTDAAEHRRISAGQGTARLSDAVLHKSILLSTTERSPRVLMYLASLLQRIEPDQRWLLAPGLLQNGDHADDANIPLLIWYGISPLVPQDPQRAIELAGKTQIAQIRQFIYRRAALDPKLLEPLIATLAGDASPLAVKEILTEMRRGAEQWGRLGTPPQWPAVVQRLAQQDDPEVRQIIRFLSITFGDASVFPELRQTVADSQQPLESRREALAALAQGRDPQLQALALTLVDDPQLRSDAIPLLARFEAPPVADRLLAAYPGLPPQLQQAAIDTLISRPAFAARLLDALVDQTVPRGDLTALHVSRISQLGDEQLLQRLSEIWGTVRPSNEQLQAEIQVLTEALTADLLATADRSAGRLLYDKTCGQCHILFGTGGDLGPDLTGADRGNVRYWLENIMDPNAIVGKDYQTITALTVDGRVVTGLLREQTDVAIVLEDAEKRVTLPMSEIEDLAETSQSLMPEGLLQPLSQQQVAQLIAYLQSPGQIPLPGQLPPIDPQTAAVPGALEGESLAILSITQGQARPQAMAGFPADRWSGHSQLWWTGGQPGDQLTVGFQPPQAGTYEVFAVLTQAVDYGVVTLQVNDAEATSPQDMYSPQVITSGPISLGQHALPADGNRLTLTLHPPNPQAAPGNMAALDYLFLVPVQAAP